MAMFHLEYPERTTFFKWDEIGCLCRALGFPSGLFQTQLQSLKDEIPYDDNGISIKTLQRIWNMNVMFKPLHRTFNMHTADWNVCTFTTALHLLTHKALSFQDLHNIRVAYMAYEHIDMKGMLLDKHTLLRTLKMCGRTIAPLKLMHRIKHMKGTFDEKGRMQLYEFFTLILWCDVYTSFKPEDMETSSGKEEDLFRLVDFHQLLTHHDDRVARSLDDQYLKEEWDFGMECLGPKDIFKEPVVNTQARVAQTQYHMKKYRHLKQEVGHSQKRVYRAHAGTIRSRPVSAPDLDEYQKTESALRTGSVTASQMYETVQRRLHSAPSRASSEAKIERPVLLEHHRAQTPQVVTPRDLSDVRLKMETLNFDINTLEVRCELQVEKEMDFYLPGYMEKLASRRPEPSPVPEPDKKPLHWTSKIVNNLAYPATSLKPAHNKTCDARFRGWQKVAKCPGTHVVLTSQTHPNTEHGLMFSKMEQTAMEPVQFLHPDYILRHTPKSVLNSQENLDKGRLQRKIPNFNFKSLKLKDETDDGAKKGTKIIVDLDFFQSKYLSGEQGVANAADGKQTTVANHSCPVGLSEKTGHDKDTESERKTLQPQIKVQIPGGGRNEVETATDRLTKNLPVPHMEHSRPKIVGVGQIGTISLLESIQESRDLEDQFIEENLLKTCEDDKQEENNDNDKVPEDEDDDIVDAEQLSMKLNLRKSVKSQQGSRQKNDRELSPMKRQSKSAPLRLQKAGNTRKMSPIKTKRRIKSSNSRCQSADDKQRQDSSSLATSCDYDSSVLSSSADQQLLKFKLARGSLTSEENDMGSKGSRDELSDHLKGRESSSKNINMNDDESYYSDAMTIPSSTGITELESPSLRRSRLQDVPDISIDLGSSVGSNMKPGGRVGQHVQFDSLREFIPESCLSMANLRPDVVTACSVGKDNNNASANDFRECFSDSGINKRVFSQQTRSRLIGRVENAISPDLKNMLLADANKISIPAS